MNFTSHSDPKENTPLQIATITRTLPWPLSFINGHLLILSLSLCSVYQPEPISCCHFSMWRFCGIEFTEERDLQLVAYWVWLWFFSGASLALGRGYLIQILVLFIYFWIGNRRCLLVYPAPSSSTMDLSTTNKTKTMPWLGLLEPSKPSKLSLLR